MRRAFLAVAGAALLGGVLYFALRSFAGGADALRELVLLTCAATLALALISAGLSFMATLRTNAITAQLSRLERSVDAAMRDLSARGHRETATIEELSVMVSRELELFSSRTPAPLQKPRAETARPRDNIVTLQASRRGRIEIADAPTMAAGPEQAGFEMAVQRTVASGKPELSLQPIVSIAQGAATGFDVFAHVDRDDGMGVDLSRLPSSLPNVSQAAFERWLIVGSIAAAARQAGTALPLHVQISEALLSDSDELGIVLSTLSEYADAAKEIVLSLPAVLVERNGRFGEALEALVGTGARLAAEGWSGNKDGLERMKSGGVAFVKLSADRLLGRTKIAKASNTAIRLVEIAAALDVPVVAVNVANDEDAVTLIDLGITLMTGNRFSGPRRLKPQDESRVERVATV